MGVKFEQAFHSSCATVKQRMKRCLMPPVVRDARVETRDPPGQVKGRPHHVLARRQRTGPWGAKRHSHFGNSWRSLKKLHTPLPLGLSHSIPRVLPEKVKARVHVTTCTRMFRAALLLTTGNNINIHPHGN